MVAAHHGERGPAFHEAVQVGAKAVSVYVLATKERVVESDEADATLRAIEMWDH